MESVSRQPEVQGLSVVALGSFNPAIFQPFWFAGANLIRKEEAKEAVLHLVHPKATIFSTDWFELHVTANRFMLETTDPTKYIVLRDLVAGTFNILEHSPIVALGFNWQAHYRLDSIEQWRTFADSYASRQPWLPVLSSPDLRTLVIEGRRDGCDADRVGIQIEPSLQFSPGLYIQINEHYQLGEPNAQAFDDRMSKFLAYLQEPWESFQSYYESVPRHLLSSYSPSSSNSQ